MKTTITMDEWLAAIKEPEVEGYTTEELAEALGYSESHFRCRLRPQMVKAGTLRVVGHRRSGPSAKVIIYELCLPQKRDAPGAKMLNVGVAFSARRRRRGSLSDVVAQLPRSEKKK